MNPDIIMRVLMCGLGICFTCFLFTIRWLIKMNVDIQKRVTFDWLEGNFEKKIFDELSEITEVLSELKDTLVGSVREPGMLTKMHMNTDAIKEIKETCEKNHE